MLLNLLLMQQNYKNIFPELSDHSRTWLYLAERKLDSTELEYSGEQLQGFLKSWKAHGKTLNCNGTFLFSQYLVLSVDEEKESASGCSIDSSVHFVKTLGNELKVDFFNRMIVLSIINDNETKSSNYFEAKKSNVPYLNPLIHSLGELRNSWVVTG